MIARPHWSAALSVISMAMVMASPLSGRSAPAQTALPGPASTTSTDGNDIVVEGSRKTLRHTLKQTLDTGPQSQLARYEDGFCPRVDGFPEEWSPIIEEIVRNNAAEAGVLVKRPGCRPNALIVFTDQPQQLMAIFEKANPSLSAHLSPAQRQLLLGKKRAAYSARVVQQLDREGNGYDFFSNTIRNAKATRLSTNFRSDIRLSVVVIDINQTPGKTLRQLADFATMHLLLNLSVKTLDETNPSSVLSLFMPHDGVAVPAQLSLVDRATIEGLYVPARNNFTADNQRERILGHITKEFRAIAAGK